MGRWTTGTTVLAVSRSHLRGLIACWLMTLLMSGCGATQQNLATQQLLESDAVDAAIAQLDFTPLAGRKVFFDTTYMQDYKGIGFVNANYVVSGIRQQILASGCELQEAKDTADVVVEGRVGTLGSDEHNVVYGIPKNNSINSVASAVPGSPTLPAIPELALAKKVSSRGAAKLALFAYDRESRRPVWQSGLAIARSSSQDTWWLGAGPFQNGTIHRNKVRFAGRRLSWRFWSQPDGLNRGDRFTAFEQGAVFRDPIDVTESEMIAGDPVNEPQTLPTDGQAAPLPSSGGGEITQVSSESVAETNPPESNSTESTAEAPTAPPAAESSPTPVEPQPFPGPEGSAVPVETPAE